MLLVTLYALFTAAVGSWLVMIGTNAQAQLSKGRLLQDANPLSPALGTC